MTTVEVQQQDLLNGRMVARGSTGYFERVNFCSDDTTTVAAAAWREDAAALRAELLTEAPNLLVPRCRDHQTSS